MSNFVAAEGEHLDRQAYDDREVTVTRGEKQWKYDITSKTRVYTTGQEHPNNFVKKIGALSGREYIIPDVNSGYYDGEPDAQSARMKFGVIVPSTNTIVEADYWKMIASNPDLIKNIGFHTGNITIREGAWSNDEEMQIFLDNLRLELDFAIDRCCTAEIQYMIMGMSAETFVGGWEGNTEFRRHIEDRTNLALGTGAEACKHALEKFGVKNIACITPYMPILDKQVALFFDEIGFGTKRVFGFKCESAVEIAHVSTNMCKEAIREIDGDDIDCIVQCGTNLSFLNVAEEMEEEIGKPIICINAASLWFALRENGINEPIYGCGRLGREF